MKKYGWVKSSDAFKQLELSESQIFDEKPNLIDDVYIYASIEDHKVTQIYGFTERNKESFYKVTLYTENPVIRLKQFTRPSSYDPRLYDIKDIGELEDPIRGNFEYLELVRKHQPAPVIVDPNSGNNLYAYAEIA